MWEDEANYIEMRKKETNYMDIWKQKTNYLIKYGNKNKNED